MADDVKIFHLNQRVEIIINNIRYSYEIMLIKEDCVILGAEEDTERYHIRLKQWQELDILIGGRIKGVVYRCKSTVYGIIEHNGRALYAIRHPVPISSENRREYYRYTLMNPVAAVLFIDDKIEDCYLENISAGGVRINCLHEIDGERIRIEFMLDGDVKIISSCSIVNRGFKEKHSSPFYSLKFENIDKKDQERIIGFIFRNMISGDKSMDSSRHQ